MISREIATQLLNKYRTQLENFQHFVERNTFNSLRCDRQFVPNFLSALEAIAEAKSFSPTVATSGMSNFKSLPTDPCAALSYLVNFYAYDQMLAFYSTPRPMLNLINPGLKETMIAFKKEINSRVSLEHKEVEKKDDQARILLYKSRNNELALKFPDLDSRNAFLAQLKGEGVVAEDKSSNSKYPLIYGDNPTTLYFQGAINGQGNFTASFASPAQRDKFYNLLIKNPSASASASGNLTPVSYESGKNDLVFEDKSILIQGKNIPLPIPEALKAKPVSQQALKV